MSEPHLKTCAIHQPNFFPWLGYFNKIRRADVFVFLDHVDYPKSGNSMGSWCNRVKINVNAQPTWISCPVVREHGPQLIDTVRIDNQRPWREHIRKMLEINYKRAPNFATAYATVNDLMDFQGELLADFNVNAIRRLAPLFGCTAELVRQSEMPASGQTSTDRLIEICRTLGADAYLCGGGAVGYQDDAAFERAGIQLVYQDFVPGAYGNADRFMPGLSVIDWLMHAGVPVPAGQ